jgi:hypothetical protein
VTNKENIFYIVFRYFLFINKYILNSLNTRCIINLIHLKKFYKFLSDLDI